MTQRLKTADSPGPPGRSKRRPVPATFQRVYRYLDKDYKVPTKDLELNPVATRW